MFVASPQKWVVEFWLTLEPGIFAKIIDSTGRGVYAEVTLLNGGDPALCFENTEDCGLKHREPDRWVHCGQITPGQLVERALSCRHPHEARKLNLAECVSEYEKSVNDYLDWRRSVGISSDEMKRTFDRVKRRRLLKD